jgi:hypothetical protein
MEKLGKIQAELKCPKGSFNSFGKYKYRSAEQILESVKPLLQKHGAVLTLTDEIVEVGSKLFLKANAQLSIDKTIVSVNGYAELGEHKGMSSEQCTGTASSYARKYALNGLFLIDETESDPDSKDNSDRKETKLPAIDAKRFQAAVTSISNGQYTREKLEASFSLTDGQIDILNAL